MTTNHDPLTEAIAAHAVTTGPVSGAWKCPEPCGAASTNGSIATNDLTSASERAAQHAAHLAEVVRAWLTTDPNSPLAAVGRLVRVWDLTEFPDESTATMMRLDLRAALTATHPTKEQQP